MEPDLWSQIYGNVVGLNGGMNPDGTESASMVGSMFEKFLPMIQKDSGLSTSAGQSKGFNMYQNGQSYFPAQQEDNDRINAYNAWLEEKIMSPSISAHQQQMEWYNDYRNKLDKMTQTSTRGLPKQTIDSGRMLAVDGQDTIGQIQAPAPPAWTPPEPKYLPPVIGAWKNIGGGFGITQSEQAKIGTSGPTKKQIGWAYPILTTDGSGNIVADDYDADNPGNNRPVTEVLASGTKDSAKELGNKLSTAYKTSAHGIVMKPEYDLSMAALYKRPANNGKESSGYSPILDGTQTLETTLKYFLMDEIQKRANDPAMEWEISTVTGKSAGKQPFFYLTGDNKTNAKIYYGTNHLFTATKDANSNWMWGKINPSATEKLAELVAAAVNRFWDANKEILLANRAPHSNPYSFTDSDMDMERTMKANLPAYLIGLILNGRIAQAKEWKKK